MLVLVVLVILAIFFTIIVVKTDQDSSNVGKSFAIVIPTQFFGLIFIVIWLVTPTKWGEVKLDAEYDLIPFIASDGNEYYASMDEGSYTIYLNNNIPTTINTNVETSIVYIKENETPRICKYVQEDEWTWYAPPLKNARVTYILCVPEGSIVY